MTTTTADPRVEAYLNDLRRAARALPRRRRAELVAEIEDHLAAALGDARTEADVLTMLDRLGPPEEIVAAEAERIEPVPRSPWSAWIPVLLLLVGGFILPVAGWFVGVVLLWSSPLWNTREKLIGTLVVPGGLVPAVVLPVVGGSSGGSCTGSGTAGHAIVTHCTGGGAALPPALAIALFAFLVIGPLVSASYLLRRARPA